MPNVYEPDWQFESDRAPFLGRAARVGAQAGAQRLGATVYEVAPGGRVSPLHVHHANEELVVVLAGRPTLRGAQGASRELTPGEVVACPAGRAGAHRVENATSEPARVLIVSTMVFPEVAEHLDSEKVLVMTAPPDPRRARGRPARVPARSGRGRARRGGAAGGSQEGAQAGDDEVRGRDDLAPGEAHDAEAMDREQLVAVPIVLEGARDEVGGDAVGLDDQALLRPQEVHLVPVNTDVRPGQREPRSRDEGEEPLLELAAGDLGVGGGQGREREAQGSAHPAAVPS